MAANAADARNTQSNVISIFFISVIFLTLSSSTNIVPGTTGDIFAYVSYTLLIVAFFFVKRRLTLPRIPFIAFYVIYFILLLNSIRAVTGIGFPPILFVSGVQEKVLHLATVSGYILSSFCTIFIFPRIVDRRYLFYSTVAIGLVTLAFGLPSYLIGDYTIGPLTSSTYTHLQPLRELGVFVPAMSSFWIDANAASKIMLASSMSNLYLMENRDSIVFKILFGVNSFGLFLANSKSAIGGYLVGVTMYLLYTRFGKTAMKRFLFVIFLGGTVGYVLVILGVGTQDLVSTLGFPHRVQLWRASIHTVSKHPFLGSGIDEVGETVSIYTAVTSYLAPQNSYLRVFIATGVIGGTLYVSVVMFVFLRYMEQVSSRTDVLLFALFISFCLVQLTDTADPFGINKNALIYGWIFGQMINEISDAARSN